jgi:hypothetical protein
MSSFDTTEGQVEALYVGYFMRAGDPLGFQYWENNLNSGTTWLQAAASFSMQPEAQLDYAFLANVSTSSVAAVTTFINQVYEDLFNRPADASGLAYWINYLQANAGDPTKIGQFILNVVSGATPGGVDDLTLQNKVAVASFITNSATTGGLTWTASLAAESAALVSATTSASTGSGSVAVQEALWTTYLHPAGPPANTFTLTTTQDNDTTGSGNDLYLAPLVGNKPTLTSLDTLIDGGTNNLLHAFFNAGGTIGGLTIQGIQTWTFENTSSGAVSLLGAAGTAFGGSGPLGGPANAGVQTINYQNSLTGSMNIGAATTGAGVQSLLTNVNFTNNVASTMNVFVTKGIFTGADTLTVNVTNAGPVSVNVGPDTGAAGYLNWVVNIGDSNTVDSVSLGATSATNAHTVTLADTLGSNGGVILYSVAGHSADWAHVATVSGAGLAGSFTVTGLETGIGTGFLSEDATALTSITGGAGPTLFDLTAYTATAAQLTINGGTNTVGNQVDLNSGVVDTAVGFAGFSGEQIVGDVDTPTGILGGEINIAFFPGIAEIVLKNASGFGSASQSADFTITNAPNTFLFNFQDDNMNGHSFAISAAGSATSALTVWLGDPGAGDISNSTGTFVSSNYDIVTLNEFGSSDPLVFGTHFTVEAASGQSASLKITGSMLLGDTGSNGSAVLTPASVGHDTVTILGGTASAPIDGAILDSGSGTLEIGVTNAASISDTSTGIFHMFAPADSFLYGNVSGDSVFSAGAFSFLQGSMGQLTAVAAGLGGGWTGATSGPNVLVTQDTLIDTAGSTVFLGEGGGDFIVQGGGGNHDEFGMFYAGAYHQQVITNNTDEAYTGFWGQGGVGTTATPTAIASIGSTSADMTSISGFWGSGTGTLDTIAFNVNAWAGGVAGPGALVDDAGTVLAQGTPVLQLIINSADAGGEINSTTGIVLYAVDGNIANAAGLASALEHVNGAIKTTDAIKANTHMLFAYESGGDTKIADVDFLSAIAANGSTAGANIAVSDMVDIVGGGAAGHAASLLGLATHPMDIMIMSFV